MRLILAAIAVLLLAGSAEAANRFWVPLTVTGAANNGSGLCRIQVGAGLATGKVTGETVTVASVSGATGCNVTTTITAIDSTHFDLVGTTFGGAYVSGGTVAGGTWNATNIGNWGTSSGTGSGAAIPGTADAVTFDGSMQTALSLAPAIEAAGYRTHVLDPAATSNGDPALWDAVRNARRALLDALDLGELG